MHWRESWLVAVVKIGKIMTWVVWNVWRRPKKFKENKLM